MLTLLAGRAFDRLVLASVVRRPRVAILPAISHAISLALLLSACADTRELPVAPERSRPALNAGAGSVNVAAAASGATVLASSVHSAAYAASGAINGDRAGVNWEGGGGWNDASINQFPDWLEVTFAASQTIDEVDVFTVQDNYQAPVAPSLGQTFTQYGLTDFQIEAWNGVAWVIVPNGSITGNTQVWRQITFPAVTTTKLRLWITGARAGYSRVTELEAWTAIGTPPGAFNKTAPSNGATPAPSGVALSWAASNGATSYEYCVDTTNNNACDGSWISTTSLTATLGTLPSGTPHYWQVRARNATGTTDANGGAWWSFTPTSTGGPRVNVASAANGATVVASSVFSAAYAASGAINGDRAGTNWAGGSGGWNDATTNQFPDWLEVTFAGSQTIDEVDLFTVQDNYQSPVAPTLGQTATQYGLSDFQVEAWNGVAWVIVPNGTITGNTQVWRQITFPAVTTTKLRLWITGARAGYSRVTELEAWTTSGTPPGAFNKTGPSTGATPAPSGVTLSWGTSSGATSYEYCVDTTNNNACDGSWISTTSLTATLGTLPAGTQHYWQVRARNATGTTDANIATWWSFTTTSSGGSRVNVAAAANGATAVASSVYSAAYAASGAINGDRAGVNWAGGSGGWNDATIDQFPDWLEIAFAGSNTIDEVDVFTVQDNYQAPVAPSLGQTSTQYGLTDFQIEAWNGVAWVIVPNGSITGNTQVWRQITFPAVTTTKLRLWITGARAGYSRVTELEAWTTSAGIAPGAFNKTAPSNGATPAPSGVALSWGASSGATSYEYCVDTTNNNVCDGSWVSTANLTATLGLLPAATPHYWQVRARNATSATDADAGAWWSFTPTSSGSGFSVAVENVYLTQATQRPDGTVSLVANRNALLRVFVTATASNTVRPDVRVRVFDGATLLQTVTISAPESSVRTAISEGVLTSTWNTLVSGANIRPGLRVVAEVDPTLAVADADRTDNVWPRGGTPGAIPVTTVPTFNVRFVPITIGGVTGSVSEANKEQFLATARLSLPINSVVTDVRAPFTSSAPALQFDNANDGWGKAISELYTLRVAEGAPASMHYYGVVRASYTSGVAGLGYLGWPAALGWDYQPSGGEVSEHEWGHNFGRDHTPCGVAGDAAYPYAGGIIGMWGWNSSTNALISPTAADFMSYCGNKWTSDWTWTQIIAYRQFAGLQTSALRTGKNGPAEGLLVWGRVVNGRVELEPSFRLRAEITPRVAVASLHVQLLDAAGATLLDVPLNAERVDHATSGDERHFAVVIPWNESLEQSLARVRVSDVRQPLASAERASASADASRQPGTPARISSPLPEPRASVVGVDRSRTRVSWDDRTFPMAMVRDALSGEILGFVRSSGSVVTTNGRSVEVVYSDGVRSQLRR